MYPNKYRDLAVRKFEMYPNNYRELAVLELEMYPNNYRELAVRKFEILPWSTDLFILLFAFSILTGRVAIRASVYYKSWLRNRWRDSGIKIRNLFVPARTLYL
ncbi:hypothetical protein RRG08_013283 [Elysia crispata]|uniref:Uncharacterized protein n=1 Tax=Elysia crispata TaxID=231223 RepID=A0AAE1AX20_9GAST|nr:hypothetical protein RRG08_013283 [Elysia crispata]